MLKVVPDYRSEAMLLREEGMEDEAAEAIEKRRKRQRAWGSKTKWGLESCEEIQGGSSRMDFSRPTAPS